MKLNDKTKRILAYIILIIGVGALVFSSFFVSFKIGTNLNNAIEAQSTQLTQVSKTIEELKARPIPKDGIDGTNGANGTNGKDSLSTNTVVEKDTVVYQQSPPEKGDPGENGDSAKPLELGIDQTGSLYFRVQGDREWTPAQIINITR